MSAAAVECAGVWKFYGDYPALSDISLQIEPGTWDYIDSTLATPPPLSRTSAQDNVRGGVLLLHSLLDQAGGDPTLAAAGYYQGLQSVREHGMYYDTQQYVNNVMALRHRFGGP